MRLSEAIKFLEQAIAENGDLELIIPFYFSGSSDMAFAEPTSEDCFRIGYISGQRTLLEKPDSKSKKVLLFD